MKIIDEPESKLETLLRLAVSEPAHRPEFYQVLLESPLWVLGHADQTADGEQQLDAGSAITIQHWETTTHQTTIPVFTSLEVMQQSIDEDESYLELPARDLFELTLGEVLVLNPDADYSKEFLPDEVAGLLQGEAQQSFMEQVTDSSAEFTISEPESYPDALVDSLTTLFSKHSQIEAAYLGFIQDHKEGSDPNLIIGLQGEGDLETIIREAGLVAMDTTLEEEYIDFVIIEEQDDGISQYFLQQSKPFYERRWGSKIKQYTEPHRT